MSRVRARAATYFIPRIALMLFPIIVTFASATPVQAVIRLGSTNTISLTNGLVGYWSLDGAVTNWATGQTADLSGNGDSGALINLSTSTSPVAGKVGQALNFNGSAVVTVGHPSVLNDLGPMSVSFWIKPNSAGGGNLGRVISKGNGLRVDGMCY